MTFSHPYTNDGSGNYTRPHAIISFGDAPTESHHLLAENKNDEDTASDETQSLKDQDEDQSNAGLLGTIVEGVEFIAEQAQEVATDLVEAAQEVAADAKETLVDDLVDKDDGESFIFEMGAGGWSKTFPGR